MADVYELKMMRLGPALEEMGGLLEEKADPPGKGGKKKPMPPWLNKPQDDDDDEPDDTDSEDESSDDEDDDEDGKPSKKPAKGKIPPQFAKGTKAARPGTGFKPKQPERGGNGRKPAVRASANRTGAEVQPIAWAGPADGGKRKKRGMGSKAAPKGAARITTWGPVNQHVDVRRGRGDGAGDQGPSDPRLRRASREQDTDSFRPRRGPAGGNGVTRAVAGNEIQQNRPNRLKKGPARRDGWSPSADVGEGHTAGRSGSAIVPNRPNNLRGSKSLRSLWEYSPEEIEGALNIAQKALLGVVKDLRSGESRDFR